MLTGKVPLDFADLYPRLYPLISISTRGKLLDWWIHKQYTGYKVVAKMYYPYNPRTIEQQSWREVFADAVAYWQGFNDQTKGYYNERTRPKGEYGYHRYLSMYLNANYPAVLYMATEAGDIITTEADDEIVLE